MYQDPVGPGPQTFTPRGPALLPISVTWGVVNPNNAGLPPRPITANLLSGVEEGEGMRHPYF